MKDQFLQMATHEINTPISVMRGRSSMLAENQGISPEIKKEVEIINNEAERLSKMVYGINLVSLIDQKKLEIDKREVDVLAVVRVEIEDKKRLFSEKGNRVEVLHGSGAGENVFCDEEFVKFCIGELLNNANKFSRNSQITLSVLRRDGVNIIEVNDRGIGIQKKDLNRVFVKFFQSARFDETNPVEQQGSGVGLYIVKNIIKLHGGDVWVDSEKGQGTTIGFSLPDKIG